MPRKKLKSEIETSSGVLSKIFARAPLPEGWTVEMYKEGSQYAVVRMPVNDIERIRLVKLPKEVREYLREKQRRYREKQKEKQGER